MPRSSHFTTILKSYKAPITTIFLTLLYNETAPCLYIEIIHLRCQMVGPPIVRAPTYLPNSLKSHDPQNPFGYSLQEIRKGLYTPFRSLPTICCKYINQWLDKYYKGSRCRGIVIYQHYTSFSTSSSLHHDA